jgi:hypothetical protein
MLEIKAQKYSSSAYPASQKTAVLKNVNVSMWVCERVER